MMKGKEGRNWEYIRGQTGVNKLSKTPLKCAYFTINVLWLNDFETIDETIDEILILVATYM